MMYKLVKHELGNYPQNPIPPQETNQLMLISEVFTLRIGNVVERLRQVNFRMNALKIPLPVLCWLLQMLNWAWTWQ